VETLLVNVEAQDSVEVSKAEIEVAISFPETDVVVPLVYSRETDLRSRVEVSSRVDRDHSGETEDSEVLASKG
jgi:hypothetical protein